MQKKLLFLFLFVFAVTNAYGLECGLECFKVYWYGRRVEQPEAGQLVQQPPRQTLIYRYDNDTRTSWKNMRRIAALKEALPSHIVHNLVEVIDDYLWMRCYISGVHQEAEGPCSAMTIQDQDGISHAYITSDSSHAHSFSRTWKMGHMTQKQMRDIVVLHEIQNKPYPANAAEQKAEDASLAVLQKQHKISDAMIALVKKRQLVTIPGEW